MGNRKRLTAFLLTAVMILTMPQMQIAAAEVESPADVEAYVYTTRSIQRIVGIRKERREHPAGMCIQRIAMHR